MTKDSTYANLDARALQTLAHRAMTATSGHWLSNEDCALLLRAAAHLESMDQKLSRRLEHEQDLVAGIAIGARRATERSNILRAQSRDVRDSDGEIILRALETGRVRKVPKNVSGLPKGETIDLTNKPSAPARKGFRLGDL